MVEKRRRAMATSHNLEEDRKLAVSIVQKNKETLKSLLKEVYKNFPIRTGDLQQFFEKWFTFEYELSHLIKNAELEAYREKVQIKKITPEEMQKKLQAKEAELDEMGISRFVKSIAIKLLLENEEIIKLMPKKINDSMRSYLYDIQDVFGLFGSDFEGESSQFDKLTFITSILSGNNTEEEQKELKKHMEDICKQRASFLQYFLEAGLPKPDAEYFEKMKEKDKKSGGVIDAHSKVKDDVVDYLYEYHSALDLQKLLPSKIKTAEEKNLRLAIEALVKKLKYVPTKTRLFYSLPNLNKSQEDLNKSQAEVLALYQSICNAIYAYGGHNEDKIQPYMQKILDKIRKMPSDISSFAQQPAVEVDIRLKRGRTYGW
jgi:hypothetical protein